MSWENIPLRPMETAIRLLYEIPVVVMGIIGGHEQYRQGGGI